MQINYTIILNYVFDDYFKFNAYVIIYIADAVVCEVYFEPTVKTC